MRRAALLALALAPADAAAAAPPAHQLGKLVAPQRQPGDRFGTAVAVDGVAGVVGSSLATINLAAQAGRVHVLTGDAWSTVLDLDATFGATTSRQLGNAAAISGPLAAFGAPVYLNNGFYAGGVFVYARIAKDIWQLEAILPAPMPGADKYVGLSVGLAQDQVIAGSLLDPPGMAGRAYAWTRTGPGAWSDPVTLSAPDPSPDDRFGYAVTVRGARAVLGAPGSDAGRGAAYVFDWTGAEWVAGGKLVAADRMPGDGFGAAVAIDGDVAIVGAPGRDGNAGAAFLFVHEGDEWVEQIPALIPADREAGSQHGRAVALQLPYAVVTAIDHTLDPNNPGPGGAGRGVWYGQDGAGSWIELATIASEDGVPGDRLGWSATLEGGVAFLGAPGDDADLGAVYLFRLEQPVGAACVADADCLDASCCGGVCALDCEVSTTGGPDPTTSTTNATTLTTGEGLPGLGIDPAEAVGCACTSGHVPGDRPLAGLAALAALALLARPRRRRAPWSARRV